MNSIEYMILIKEIDYKFNKDFIFCNDLLNDAKE